ncbi:MAG TPA: acyl-CoA dehydrogenase family protein [Tepidiformaceae bacterium]|nr:acyl-CoA dehydrogenase family protein [Tepidiformaceae bacterium]
MPADFTPEGLALQAKVKTFMDELIYPNEEEFERQYRELGDHSYPPILDDLKAEARNRGLWNMFLPHLRPGDPGTKLSNLDYAPISEELGKVTFAPEVFNCNAPDTGNMEVLNTFATERIRQEWLTPLLNGDIRSGFAMTEPDVASSDATNISLQITKDGDEYVLNGRKWFTTGALADRCRVFIVMGKSNPNEARHKQQSMIVVPKATPGVTVERSLTVFGGEDRGGHGQILFENVRVPADHLLGEEGSGFAISQARLGPGRIHHCMRTIGVAERALELMCKRAMVRHAFGSLVAQKGLIQDWIAESRVEIDMAREYVLRCAHMMDTVGNKGAANEIAGIKVAVPNIALKVIDRAIQVHGAAGVTQDTPLAAMWANTRTIRLADGPDEVHKMTIARRELKKYDPNFHMNPQAGDHDPQVFQRP